MILIVGGAYQGKLAYALERFQLTESDVYRCGKSDTKIPHGTIIYGLENWILSLIKADIDVLEEVQKLIDLNADAVIICGDISCGVVPADAVLRKWREDVGRSLAILSQESAEVIRLFCGIPSKIK